MELVELLDELNRLPDGDPRRKPLDERFLHVLDRHLRDALKPFLEHKFPGATGPNDVARFTEMLNDFFIKILTMRPDAVWKAKSAIEIRKWTSIVVSRQILDVLRRKRDRHEFPGDGLAALVEDRRSWFLDKTGLEFDAGVLERVEAWCSGDDEALRLMGSTLRHRYVDGMPRIEIARQLGVSEHAVRQAHDDAVERLHRLYRTGRE